MDLIWLHALIAVFAAFRLTTLFTVDSLWSPVRRRFPKVPWGCSLCMSVWAGIVATIFMALLPWLNWPLALSWLYLSKNAKETPKVENQDQVVKTLQLRLEALSQQRNQAMDQVVVLQAEVARLSEEVKKQEVVKPEVK